MSDPYLFNRRRQWSPERRARDKDRRRREGAHIRRYVSDPWTQERTKELTSEEEFLIAYLHRERRFKKLWTLLEELTGKRGSERQRRPERQKWLTLINRLIKEKKLVRYRKGNMVGLAPNLR